MHAPEKFGDDLSVIRNDFAYVNQFKKPIDGFRLGKYAKGFRHIFPVIINGVHYGALEISFDTKSFEEQLLKISNLYSHILIKEKKFTKF